MAISLTLCFTIKHSWHDALADAHLRGAEVWIFSHPFAPKGTVYVINKRSIKG